MGRLIIGAAHTLMQPGEIFQDLKEAELTRKILQKTLPHLDKNQIEYKAVPLDLPLLQRIEWINNTGFNEEQGDIFIEIHVNDGGKRGIENWFSGDPGEDNNSERLAKFLIDEMCTTLKFEKQGAKSEHEHELTSLLILNQTNTISVATELMYIDNPEDIKLLKDEQKLDEVAKALADSVKKFFEDIKTKPLSKNFQKKNSVGVGKTPALPGNALGGGIPNFGAGGFGGNLPAFGGGATTPALSSTPKSSNLMMDREQRKDMVIKTYTKMTGKEPNQTDLNNYLNQGVSEEELVVKIANSKEFEDIIKDAKEAKDIKAKAQDTENELATLRSQVNDLKKMLENLNNLLAFKNQAILQMQNELVNRNITKKGEYFDPNRRN